MQVNSPNIAIMVMIKKIGSKEKGKSNCISTHHTKWTKVNYEMVRHVRRRGKYSLQDLCQKAQEEAPQAEDQRVLVGMRGWVGVVTVGWRVQVGANAGREQARKCAGTTAVGLFWAARPRWKALKQRVLMGGC